MLSVDFHCHTLYSKDSLASFDSIIRWSKKKQIDRVAITDHNSIAGAISAQKMAPELIIVGEEIKTQDGELLAYFLQQEVPSGLPANQAIALLKDQNAFICVSHPFDTYRNGHWRLPSLLAILPELDAIEVFNARCMTPKANEQAKSFSLINNIPGTAGSDAHAAFEIGNAILEIPDFWDADSLRKVIGQAKIRAKLAHPLVHITSWYARWKKSRNLISSAD